ncbi:MAG: FAD:protein FMN transferase [Candidatus Margulisbacteria bacterium]|nr:FAD:protein FMN transferase [Candidatus Margulisiibacteriota bacterium]MBU1022460.1 FAD:protein FMN transferase [Candidatus Margulisiibacteriota bacterium]MBU1728444.1 FAD:protein FMN transferase [Candidatus Margulisiibacteriota bacterium]MBU1954591.1 FAD:protein FMN transferase [Candidatus Margulisiibacteriota bacterium]
MRKIFIFTVLLLILVALVYIYTAPRLSTQAESSKKLLGTTVDLKIYGQGAKLAERDVIKSIEKTQDLIDGHKQRSEISLINNMAGIASVAVSPTTFNVVKRSLALSKATGGNFDISIGPLADLWKAAIKTNTLPETAAVKKAIRLTDYRMIDMDFRLETIKLPSTGMKLDVGAVGKGYAFDLANKILEKHKIKSALLSCGSSIVAIGKNPQGKPWKIAVSHPRKTEKENFLGYVELEDQALSTTGDYEQFSVINGKRFSHIIDPVSGYPAEGVQAVTVIAKNGTDADAYSTAIFVMGVKKGLYFLNSQSGVEGLIVDQDGKVHKSKNFKLIEAEEET